MVYTEITPAERNRMREALKPVYQKYSKTLGEDIVNQTLSALEAARAGK